MEYQDFEKRTIMKKEIQLTLLLFIVFYSSCFSQSHGVTRLKTMLGHTEPINCLSYSPNGKYLASGSAAQSILSDSGKFEIIIWNTLDSKIITHLIGHQSPILSVSFDNSGKHLVSCDSKGDIRIWSVDSMKLVKFIFGSGWISSVCFTPDGKFIIGEFTFEKKVNIWDSESGELIATLPVNIQIGCMDISKDGSKIALSCYHKIQIWSLISKRELVSIEDNSINGYDIQYSNDGMKLAVGLGNGQIKIFDSERLSLLSTLKGHFKPVLSISFSADDKYMVSGSSDQVITIWNLQTKKIIASLLNEHMGSVNAVTFSNSNYLFATAGRDKQVKIWKIH